MLGCCLCMESYTAKLRRPDAVAGKPHPRLVPGRRCDDAHPGASVGPRLRSQQPHSAQQGEHHPQGSQQGQHYSRPEREAPAPTPEHGPGENGDEEEDGGIAGAHDRPRLFRNALTARATGPPAVQSASSDRAASARFRSAVTCSRSVADLPTRQPPGIASQRCAAIHCSTSARASKARSASRASASVTTAAPSQSARTAGSAPPRNPAPEDDPGQDRDKHKDSGVAVVGQFEKSRFRD